MPRGHEVLLRAQGAVTSAPRAPWRLGWLSLDDGAFGFRPPAGRGSVRIDLRSVTRLATERRRFVVTLKPVIRLTYLPNGAPRPLQCWVITARIGDWEAALAERVPPAAPSPLPVSKADAPGDRDLAVRLAGLTGAAALVLDYLAARGRATTRELLALTGAASEEELLLELEEPFRGVEVTLGRPAVRYEGARFDSRSRGVHRQSLWPDETLARMWLASRAPADVLVEGDDLVVVTSVPTEARSRPLSVRVDANGRALALSGAGGYRHWIALPEAVLEETRSALSDTGTLVVRARRQGDAL